MLALISVCVLLFASVSCDDYTPSEDQYLLEPIIELLKPLGWLPFDGPPCISSAPVTPSKNQLPSVEDLNYYMYYAASTYYTYDLDDLSCEYCLKIKPDIADHSTPNCSIHDTLALVARSDKRKEIVVAFRGTFNVWNIVLDALLINGRVDPNSNIKLHTGYYIATRSLYDEVVRAIACQLKFHRNYKVVLTGHSLGGAMARETYFFLSDLKQFPGVKYELYTYGEPRGGNKEYADYMNSQTIKSARVVARADIFPHINPTSILGLKLLGDFFVHSQTELWINGKDEQRFCNQSTYEDPNCSNSMGPLYSVLDHFFYFDVNLMTSFGQPLLMASLPFGILDVANVLPPLPEPIEDLLGGLLGGLGGALVGLLG